MFIFAPLMAEYNNKVCTNILEAMAEKGFRRQDMAYGLGVTYNQMCNLLNGRCKMDVDKLNTISELLEVPIQSLL